MMDETVYVSISTVSNAKIEVVKMFEFLKIIIISLSPFIYFLFLSFVKWSGSRRNFHRN